KPHKHCVRAGSRGPSSWPATKPIAPTSGRRCRRTTYRARLAATASTCTNPTTTPATTSTCAPVTLSPTIDPHAHQVVFDDGHRLGYDRLVLCTGVTPRRLPLPGADADGVLYLRSVDDSDQLRATLATASSIAIVGGGWIGLEVAAAAVAAGVAVTVVARAPVPLTGVLGPQMGQVFAELHRSHGVDLRTRRSPTEILTHKS